MAHVRHSGSLAQALGLAYGIGTYFAQYTPSPTFRQESNNAHGRVQLLTLPLSNECGTCETLGILEVPWALN